MTGAPTIRTLLGHQQRTSAALSELASITAAMATEMAQLANPATEGDHVPAARLWGQLCEDRDRLLALLGEILPAFTQRGFPGRASLRTGWIQEEKVSEWRAQLAELVGRDPGSG